MAMKPAITPFLISRDIVKMCRESSETPSVVVNPDGGFLTPSESVLLFSKMKKRQEASPPTYRQIGTSADKLNQTMRSAFLHASSGRDLLQDISLKTLGLKT